MYCFFRVGIYGKLNDNQGIDFANLRYPTKIKCFLGAKDSHEFCPYCPALVNFSSA